MKKSIFLSLGFLIFLFNNSTLNAQTWAEIVSRSEKQYDVGNYSKAVRKIKKARKKVASKHGNKVSFSAWLDLQLARIYEGKGLMQDSKVSFDSALRKAESYNQEYKLDYVVTKIHIADYYIKIGEYLKAIELLEKLDNQIQALPLDKEIVALEKDTRLLQAYINTGDFTKGSSIKSDLVQRWSEMVKVKKLSKAEKKYRRANHLIAMILTAVYESKRGYYKKAESILIEAKHKIKQLSNNSKSAYVQYYLAIADNLNEGDFKPAKDIRKSLEKTVQIAGKKLKKSSYLHLEAQEHVIERSIMRRKRFKYQEDLEYYDKILYAFYKKGKNIYKLKRKYLDAKRKFVFNANINAAKDLQTIIDQPFDILPETHPIRVDALELLYKIYTKGDNDIVKAKQVLDKLTNIKKSQFGPNATNFKYQQILLGDYLLQYSNNIDSTKLIYVQEKAPDFIYKEYSKGHKKYINTLNQVSKYYYETDQLEKRLTNAQLAYDNVVEIKGKDNLMTGQQFLQLAEANLDLGKYKTAEAQIQLTKEVITNNTNSYSLEYADLLSKMAKLYSTIGNYDKAEDYLRTANRIYKRSRETDASDQASSIEELASLYLRIGEYSLTENLLTTLLKRKEEAYGKDSKKLIKTLSQLGNLYTIKGDFKEAQVYATRAEEIAINTYGKESLKYASTLETLAEFYTNIGDYEKARDFINQAIKIQENRFGKNHIKNSQALTTLADITLREDATKVKEAEKILNQVRDLNAKTFGTDHPNYAESLKSLAYINLIAKEYDTAKENLKAANNIYQAKLNKYNPKSAEVALLLGDIYRKEEKFSRAKTQYLKAQKIYTKIFNKDHPSYIKTLGKLGQIYFIEGNYKQANAKLEYTTKSYLKYIKNFFPALSEREKARFWNLIRDDFEFYNSLAVAQATDKPELLGKMYDNQLATKGILLSSSIKIRKSIQNSNDETLKKLFVKWVEQKEYLTSVLSMSPESLKENKVNPKDIEKDIEKLEKEISKKSDIFASNLKEKATTWANVRDVLKTDEAIVEVIRFRNFKHDFTKEVLYAALVVDQNSKKNPTLVLLKNGNDLENKILKYYRNTNRFNLNDKHSYDNYWKAIAEKIEGKKVVYFSPDGVYNQINPEALRITKDTFVIDRQNVRLVSNSKDLIDARKTVTQATQSNQDIVLYGNPKFYIDIAKEDVLSAENSKGTYITDLPGTKKEINDIVNVAEKTQSKVLTYTEENAKEEILKKVENPKILHIATHGFFMAKQDIEGLQNISTAQNPMLQSGVLASGAGDIFSNSLTNFNTKSGVFTSYEASNLNLANTELVTLSACETGLGEVQVGEGVFGLQRAFLIAGTKSVIMSLFKVNDDITQELMSEFYSNYLIKKQTKRVAFNNAQKHIKQKYKKPIYWGAFNMIGVD